MSLALGVSSGMGPSAVVPQLLLSVPDCRGNKGCCAALLLCLALLEPGAVHGLAGGAGERPFSCFLRDTHFLSTCSSK